MTDYLEENRPLNQKNIVDGVCINPLLRNEFDITSNSSRPHLETADWWGRAYIESHEYSPSDNSYDEYITRMKSYRDNDTDYTPKKEWEEANKAAKKSFYESYPTGTMYNVRILDGGAWDRSTWKGAFDNLDDAIELAKELSKQFNLD